MISDPKNEWVHVPYQIMANEASGIPDDLPKYPTLHTFRITMDLDRQRVIQANLQHSKRATAVLTIVVGGLILHS